MVRRFVIAGLGAALAAPLCVAPRASAAVLFTCPAVADGAPVSFSPGLSHTQTAQEASFGSIQFGTGDDACSNGEAGWLLWGDGVSPPTNPVLTYPARPLGCPVAWGGTGPDYADQTPILIGATDPSFRVIWSGGDNGSGIAKAKAGPVGTQFRFVFNVTAGRYAPPAGKRTKIKFTVDIAPHPSVVSYTCANDSDPLETVELSSVGGVIVTQK
jgi:hypothetical protein